MSTSAGLDFNHNLYAISHDGDPESAIPYLKNLVKKAIGYAEEHNMDFDEGMWIILEKERKNRKLLLDYYPGYEYQITDNGEVQMLSADGDSWFEYDSIKEEYFTLVKAEELDDVDVSLSTMQARNKRIEEIQHLLHDTIRETWDEEIDEELADPKTTMASGAPYN